MTKKRKQRVYISGKMRGMDEAESRSKFETAQKRLEADNCIVINPWNINHGVFTNEWEDFIIEDLWYLKQCDAVYFLDNYIYSCGAMVEYWFAKGRRMTMLFEEDRDR